MKILIADDNQSVHETIKVYLYAEGFEADDAYNGREALALFKTNHYDFVILDIMMPELFGTEVCKEIRKISNVPIMMLSAKSDEFDRVLGLEIGADDYITKPFSPREVVTRIKTIYRRTSQTESPDIRQIVTVGNMNIDVNGYQIEINKLPLDVTPKEFELLLILAQNLGRVFSRDQLLEKVWEYDYIGDTRTVDTHVNRLRKKMSQFSNIGYELVSVYGVGYKLEEKPGGKS